MGLFSKLFGSSSEPEHSELVQETADTINESNHGTTIYTDQSDYQPEYGAGTVNGVVEQIDQTNHRPDLIVDSGQARSFVIEVKTIDDLEQNTQRAIDQLNAFDQSPRHSVALVVSDEELSVASGIVSGHSDKLPDITVTTPSKITQKM